MPKIKKRTSAVFDDDSEELFGSSQVTELKMKKSRKSGGAEKENIQSEDLFTSPVKSKQKQRNNSLIKKPKDDDVLIDTSTFGEMVNGAGFILKKGDNSNLLSCDQAVFQRDLRRALRTHNIFSQEEAAKEFIKGLEAHIEDLMRLKWALHYTQTTIDCESARGGQQDSLIRLLLNIDPLQARLIQLLTEKLLEVAHDDTDSSVDVPRLILANLRWLEHVVDPEKLTTNVLELLEGSPTPVQKDLITFVPDIVDDSNHARVAEKLCELYSYETELTISILDALPNLTLAPESVENVRHSVLKTLQAAQPHHLPVIMYFILHHSSPSIAYQIASDIREKVHLPPENEAPSSQSSQRPQAAKGSSKEDAAYQVLFFRNIKMASLIHKYLINAWLKAINDVEEVKMFRPLDFLLLIVLYDAIPAKRKNIESIVRNKIRAGLFTNAMLEQTFECHPTVLSEYFESVKKIASLLTRSPEVNVRQYGKSIYRHSFSQLESYQRQVVVLALLGHLSDPECVRGAVLDLLVELAHSHTQYMMKYTIFIKGSLELVEGLSLGEIKRLLDVVSLLAYTDGAQAGLHDELHILIRKQITHSNIKYKRIGVMSAVLAVKNMIQDKDTSHNSTTSSSTSSVVPEGQIKEAENMLRLVMSSTESCPLATALFLDQMASTILRDGLHTRLEEWLSERTTTVFQDSFVIDYNVDARPPEGLLPISVSYNLEEEADEEGNAIVLNLAPMVYKAEQLRHNNPEYMDKLITMTPQFRLLRMVESHLNNGDLENIDALLGCPVYTPELSVYDKFDSLSQAEQHAAISCLFYTINWFRELINAFVTMKDPELKKKVFGRLRQVIELQKLLCRVAPLCPSYIPVLAVFDLDASQSLPALSVVNTGSKKNPGAKKGKKKAPAGKGKGKGKGAKDTEATQVGSQTQPSLSQTILPTQDGDDKEGKTDTQIADLSVYRPYLRELHIDVFFLLFRAVNLDIQLNSAEQLNLPELEFLLTELNLKLTQVFEAGTKRFSHLGKGTDKSIGHSCLMMFTPAEVAQQFHRYLKPVCVHLEKISGHFQSLLVDNDGILDAPGMFSDCLSPIVRVYTNLFQTLAIFFAWPGLQLEQHCNTLLLVLRTIAKKLEGDAAATMGKEALVTSVFTYIANFHESITNINTAMYSIKTLETLISLHSDEDLKEKLVEVIDGLLKREWYNLKGEKEKGAIFNSQISTLLQAYLVHSADQLSVVELLCSSALGELMEAPKGQNSTETFPTLNKQTLNIYYKTLLAYLCTGIKKSLAKFSSLSGADEERLEVWQTAIKVFHLLIVTLKKFDNRVLVGSCLKYSRGFLELFLRLGMPVMDRSLRTHKDEVLTLLKNLQGSTRFIQNICIHSKVTKDTSLTRYVPLLKRSLEMLLYRVKTMLAVNKCSGAFWMGNLKNRDLQGEEILSQSMRSDGSEDGEEGEEEEENAAEEEEQSDVELDEDEDQEIIKKDTTKGDEEEEETIRTNYSDSF